MRSLIAMATIAVLTSCTFAADWESTFKKTYVSAEQAAKADNKPMYLHFTTTWCGWCRKIEKDVYSDDGGLKALGDFVPATLDCTDTAKQPATAETKINIGLMKKFSMSGYPSLVIVLPDGAVLHSWAGYVPLDEFPKELDKAKATEKEYKQFLKDSEKADKTAYDYNAKALAMYVKVQKWDAAVEAGKQINKLDPKNEKGDGAQIAFAQYKAGVTGDQGAEKIQAGLDAVAKADPKNEKGFLEKAYADSATMKAQKGDFKGGAADLAFLTTNATKLSNAQETWANLGMFQLRAGDKDKAKASFQKAIEADPLSEMAPKIKQFVEKLDQAGQ